MPVDSEVVSQSEELSSDEVDVVRDPDSEATQCHASMVLRLQIYISAAVRKLNVTRIA